MPKSSKIQSLNPRNKDADNDGRILLFDLFVSGHHPGYILHLIKYWHEQRIPGSLDILVTPKFCLLHPEVVDLALRNSDYNNIRFLTISLEEEAKLKSEATSRDRMLRSFQEWNLLDKYVSYLKPTKCLLMYIDSILLSLAIKGISCPLSGIYFRPIFHYGEFTDFSLSRKERLLQFRDKVVISRVLNHPNFQTLFCLDQFAKDSISTLNGKVKAVHLPDPVQIYKNTDVQPEKFNEKLEIHPGRKTFLMFGVPQKRKGIDQLIEAINLLPSYLCQEFCLLIVGPLSSEPSTKDKLTELSKTLPLQVIVVDKFVPDQEVQVYFQIADVILAPYQRHVGMSAILVRAAAALKPVLSSNYGLMGEIVKRHKLGVTVDSRIPVEIAKGLKQYLTMPAEDLCSHHSMKQFAGQNSAEKFADTIFDYL